jgi:hypothetical protein
MISFAMLPSLQLIACRLQTGANLGDERNFAAPTSPTKLFLNVPAQAHTVSHLRTVSVAPSGVASKIGDASTAWRRRKAGPSVRERLQAAFERVMARKGKK